VETEAELAQRQSSCFESGDQLLLRSLGEREVQHNGESSKEQRSRRYKTPSSPDPQSVDGLRLPPGWALSSIEQISSGLRYSLCIGPFGSNLKVSDYCEEGVPLIFVRNIRAENFSIEQATFVTHVKAAELAAHMARPGDILITKMGDPPGDSAIYPAGFPEAVITADVIKLHVASTYSLRFILYALRSPFLRRQILSQTKGVAQKKVSLERFAKIPIPIPPFAEQERIADEVERRFSVLDQVEATVNASFRRCGQLRQAVLKRAFAG
jgi:type I restriction enzyme S subunit